MDDLDTKAVDFVYDPAGKIQQVNDPTGTYTFAYNNFPAGFSLPHRHVGDGISGSEKVNDSEVVF
jgi:hypothetical protein